ncbi:hypothetical protein COP1_019057 [Malus domestica]
MMLLAGLVANGHFAYKAVHVDYRSVAPTMNVCSSVGLVESACSSARLDRSIRYVGGPIGSVHYRTLSSWLIEWQLARTLLERFFICPCPTLGLLVWGTLDLGGLQELIH